MITNEITAKRTTASHSTLLKPSDVSWPSARPSMNSRSVSQPNCPTTWSWMNAIHFT